MTKHEKGLRLRLRRGGAKSKRTTSVVDDAMGEERSGNGDADGVAQDLE
jgi:hypothetical protein